MNRSPTTTLDAACCTRGSVNPGNAAELVAQPHVDGLFIGRSAWDADGYIDILRRVAAAIEA